MFVSVTSLRLKSFLAFLKLSWHGLKISQQAKDEAGFIKMKNSGFGKLHFPLTQWKTEEDLKRFARSGNHLNAIKVSAKLATEIKTYTYSPDSFPSWSEAKAQLNKNGKVLEFR